MIVLVDVEVYLVLTQRQFENIILSGDIIDVPPVFPTQDTRHSKQSVDIYERKL